MWCTLPQLLVSTYIVLAKARTDLRGKHIFFLSCTVFDQIYTQFLPWGLSFEQGIAAIELATTLRDALWKPGAYGAWKVRM